MKTKNWPSLSATRKIRAVAESLGIFQELKYFAAILAETYQ
jgi:hypothetical protein